MSALLGCGRRVTIHMLGGPSADAVPVDCGAYYQGELIQCEDCQEAKPAPSADPDDFDAQAEQAAERAFDPHHNTEK